MDDRKQVFFIHGATAFSDYERFLEHLRTVPLGDPLEPAPKRWKHTLGEDLGAEYEVFMPSMPNKQNAKFEEWKIWFERHFEFLRDGVILIGHSQGGYFLAKYLTENTLPLKARAVYMVAAPFEPDDFSGEDGGDFSFDTSRLANLLESTEHVFIFHSKDDPVVPLTHAERYKEALASAELVLFEDRGHFNTEEFPEIVEHIRRLA